MWLRAACSSNDRWKASVLADEACKGGLGLGFEYKYIDKRGRQASGTKLVVVVMCVVGAVWLRRLLKAQTTVGTPRCWRTRPAGGRAGGGGGQAGRGWVGSMLDLRLAPGGRSPE
jgi:hypothetical protein